MLLNPIAWGGGMSQETKAKIELAKARSNKRKFGSFRRSDSGEFQLWASQIAQMSLADWNALKLKVDGRTLRNQTERISLL